MKKLLIVLLVVAVAVGAYLVLKPKKGSGPEASSSPTPAGAGVKGSKTPEPQVQGGANPSPKTYQVLMSETAFSVATLTVKKGDKVTFSNQSSQQQTVTADNGAFTGTLAAGANWTLDTTNLAAGTYAYHSSQPSMKATLVVQ